MEDLLADRWSPQQIAGRLRRTYPDDEEMHVSHETIYLTLFIQARGGLKRELTTASPHPPGEPAAQGRPAAVRQRTDRRPGHDLGAARRR